MVELDQPGSFPEGAAVTVSLVEDIGGVDPSEVKPGDSEGQMISTLYDRFKDWAGTIKEGLPEDLAENHEHYLYGNPTVKPL